MELSANLEQFCLHCFLSFIYFCAICLLLRSPKPIPPSDLSKFYGRVTQDRDIEQRLEKIIAQDNFIEQIVILGASLNYSFTVTEVRDSIDFYTHPKQEQYLCLPIGCWQKARS